MGRLGTVLALSGREYCYCCPYLPLVLFRERLNYAGQVRVGQARCDLKLHWRVLYLDFGLFFVSVGFLRPICVIIGTDRLS